MKILSKLSILSVCMVAFMPVSANAIPVEWTLGSWLFADLGTASGSFTFDADTNDFSNVNITTTPEIPFFPVPSVFGATYTRVNPNPGAFNSSFNASFVTDAPDLTNSPFLFAIFPDFLTNAGGFMDLGLLAKETFCLDNLCINAATPLVERRLLVGSIFGEPVSAVPLPAALPLFGAALSTMGLAGWRRRRKAVA